MRRLSRAALAVVTVASLPGLVHATNGYFSHGYEDTSTST